MMTAIAILTVIAAESLHPTFDAAVTAQADGNHAEAIAIYERLVSEGVVNADLFYNLGNAYAMTDRIGPAIANYRRALHIRPRFTQAQENLSRCLDSARRGLAPPLEAPWRQALTTWSNSLHVGGLKVILVLLNAAFWALLALRTFRPVAYARVCLVVLAVGISVCGLAVWARTNPLPITLASQPVVPVRYGTSDEDPIHFELYDGDQVAIETTAGAWVRVRTVDGERGWAKADDFTPVTPPYSAAPPLKEATDDDV